MTSMRPATRYVLEEQLGAGGYCEVWRAADTVLGRTVAVKMLHPGYAQQTEALTRFKAEALHVGALSHQNIARVYDYGEPDGGQPYLVMEVVDGPSLAEVLKGGALDAVRTMDIVAQVAAGLQAAHLTGLIHRDITPANILFTSDAIVKITDFGIAYAVGSVPLTTTGSVMGTPGYIAPERVSGNQTGPQSDLYALGVVAYECLTGTRPFTGPPLDVAIAHRDQPLPPLPPSVPGEVAALVMMLTAKDPAWRPGSAGEVAAQAARLRDALAIGTAEPSPPAGLPPTAADDVLRPTRPVPARRNGRPGLSLAAAGLAAIIGLVVLSVIGFAPGSSPSGSPSSGSQPSNSHPAVSQPPAAHPAASQTSASHPAASHQAVTQSSASRPSVSGSSGSSSASEVSSSAAASSATASAVSHSDKHQGNHGNGNGNEG
jgi:serine/threonine-protein kinase